MLEIASDKIAHVIVKAREYDAKVDSWDDSALAGDAEEDPASIFEDFANDPTRAELAGFIDALNDDEQAHLVRNTRHPAARRLPRGGPGAARHFGRGRREGRAPGPRSQRCVWSSPQQAAGPTRQCPGSWCPGHCASQQLFEASRAGVDQHELAHCAVSSSSPA
jgi:hypothetical protein